MVAQAHIDGLRQHGGVAWITALRGASTRKRVTRGRPKHGRPDEADRFDWSPFRAIPARARTGAATRVRPCGSPIPERPSSRTGSRTAKIRIASCAREFFQSLELRLRWRYHALSTRPSLDQDLAQLLHAMLPSLQPSCFGRVFRTPGASLNSNCPPQESGARNKPRQEPPGIQSVPANGTPAIAAASTVNAQRSSGSRLRRSLLPQARAMVCASNVMTFR